MDGENEGGLACGVIPEMVWAIEKSRYLLKVEYKKTYERECALSETDEELDVAREVGAFESGPVLGVFFESKPLCSESPRTRET